MTPEGRERISELFEAALEREPNERDEFLEESCSDEEIRTEVKSLLAEHEKAGNFMKEPVLASERALFASAQSLAHPAIGEVAYRQLSERYEILAEVGRGGMAIVYKARDRITGEIVALKILKPEVASDQVAMERFKNELRLARKITHKNVCRIHEFSLIDGTAYISMEFVEGESLREILRRFGGLSLRKGIEVALQICDGLQEAHSQKVVHRDLKPGNIMIDRSGHAKVMDFGIARSVETGVNTGTAVIGTPAYMAPEQAQGKNIDDRTDIYSLGLILYEIFTGKPAFTGDTPVSVALKQINEIPRCPRELEPTIPLQIEKVILRCVEKDPANRYQTLSEWKSSWTKESAVISPVLPSLVLHKRWLIYLVLASLALVAAITGIVVWNLKPSVAGQPSVARITVDLPPGERLAGLGLSALTVSPKGSELAYVAKRNGIQQLFRRALDSQESKPVSGTEGALSPFYSPDGQSLGFCADGKLKTVAVNGGAPVVLAPVFSGCGGSWGNAGQIIFSPSWTAGLMQVSALGGMPKALTALDRERGEGGHRFPHHLPGGRALLFTVGTGGSWDDARIEVLRPDTGQRKLLINGGSDARYVHTGHIVFVRGATLLAVPFDLARLEVTGPPMQILEGVMPSVDKTGAAQFGFSNAGWLVYAPGNLHAEERQLVWVDRSGAEQAFPLPPRPYTDIKLSPDGHRLALSIDEGNKADIWLYEVSRAVLTRQSFAATNSASTWTPDGKKIAYYSDRDGQWNLYWSAADGSGVEERLTSSESPQIPWSWSPDGQLLAYSESHPTTGIDISVLSLRDGRKAQPFLRTPFNEDAPVFSPDGRWLAYQSNESGRNEVYVQPYPGPGGKWMISSEGGVKPLWASDGRELFYRNGDKMMVVKVATRPEFRAAKPEMLFEGDYKDDPTGPQYDVTPTGRRFVMMKESDLVAAATKLNVVLNWFEEVKRKVPAKYPR
ncbi:MAG: serine/threonine-protein kinase [Acidobacteriia bacterium]|nr:serine/threonine-protein kinase [Terriglobia bacterium]